MSDTKIEKYYQVRAETIVDTLFDKGYFIKGVSRKDMNHVEEWIAFELQSTANSTERAVTLLRSIKESK